MREGQVETAARGADRDAGEAAGRCEHDERTITNATGSIPRLLARPV
jgi:hypothetical protein